MIKDKEIIKRIILIFLVLIIVIFLVSFFNLKQIQPIGKKTITTSSDNIAPSVSVIFPTEYYETTISSIIIRGVATDNTNVKEVRIKLNNNNWEKVSGTNSWSKELNLNSGENIIYVQAFDSNDNASPVVSRNINYK